MTDNQYLIRVACALPGHETDWIEFDTSGWTLADFRTPPTGWAESETAPGWQPLGVMA